MRRWAVLLVFVVLAGCTTERVGGSPSRPSSLPESATGPVDLRVPIDMSRVTPAGTTATTTSVVPDQQGVPLTLEPPFLTITRLENATVQFQEAGSTWGVLVRLTDEDADVFGDWTTEHIGEQVAMVADGEVISAPQISSAITGGEVVITGPYDQDEAGDLLDQITGR
ncbi:SecDF P1 head subdomain-containing protein [Actinophytocola sp.]|uniref:SecDF P1 head subdomain-containing protein n=1 Tax=Actinophytocola sp. TaxID=1872138 RepID=UPI003D6C5900